MKKFSLVLVATFLLLFTVACSASQTSNLKTNDSSSSSTDSSPQASNFPKKPIKMVIPYAPGGATDVLFRMIASEAEKHLGQPIVPVNMKGATATIGSRHVKDADPDGYTILASHDVIATANISGVVDYSFEAFEPIALLTQTLNIPTVNKQLGVTNVKEFVEYVKANPGKIKWGMTPGDPDHFHTTLIMEELGLTSEDIRLVGYQGTGPQIAALIGNEIQGASTNVPSGMSYYEEGSLVPLGISHDERLSALPDIPTMQEQGVDVINATSRGLFAPKGTPAEIIVKIETAFKKAVEDPEMQKKISEEQGSIVKFLPHDEYKGYLDKLQAKLKKLAESMDLKK
jgi:tripartite-type tricarboxylate transporter receptor subunit TctC